MKLQLPWLILTFLAFPLVSFLSTEARAEIFEIVTQKNCALNSQQEYYNCRFPRIAVVELREHLLPIPFESVITVNPTRECRLNATESALRIRLARSGPGKSNFLRYEDFAMDHFRQRTLSSPQFHPLGKVSIYPMLEQIFQNVRFSRDCRITITVELNRIALRSKEQANEHTEKLNQQLHALQQTHAALTALRHEQNQRAPILGLFDRLQGFAGRNQRTETSRALRLQWDILLAPIRESIAALHQLSYRTEELHELEDQIEDFTETLNRVVEEGENPPESITELLERAQTLARGHGNGQAVFVLSELHLTQIADELRNFESKLTLAQEYLRDIFPEEPNNRRVHQSFLDNDFIEAFDELINGPQGIIDELRFRLSRVGKKR